MKVYDLTNREKQLLAFLRQLGRGDVKIRLENGQPVVIYEVIKTRTLNEDIPLPPQSPVRKKANLSSK